MTGGLNGRVIAVSPHLDDAAFSLGATLYSAARAGADVLVVTVFAGDPTSGRAAGAWDRRAGFATEGEAARRRREEDGAACARLGLATSWLPIADGQYGPVDADAAWAALEPLLAGAETILLPGFPLVHEDHLVLTRNVLERLQDGPRMGLYAEQPYAMIMRRETAVPATGRAPSPFGEIEWQRLRPAPRAWLAKQYAVRAYRSQLGAIARPLQRVPALVALHEHQAGGETLGWLARRPASSAAPVRRGRPAPKRPAAAPADVPIAVFAYNRPDLLRRTLECLRAAGAKTLFLFSDGPRTHEDSESVRLVREVIRSVDWAKPEVVERETNLGNTASTVAGVTAVLERHDRIVVIEDDILVAPEFLAFMCAALDEYEQDASVAGVTGLRLPFSRRPIRRYPYDAYLLPRFFGWSWGTWRRAWETFELDGERLLARLREERPRLELSGADLPYMVRTGLIERTLEEPWDVCIAASVVLNRQSFVVPAWNMVENIGLASGTHPHDVPWLLRWEVEHRPVHRPFRFPPVGETDGRILKAFRIFRENPRGWTARRFVPRPARMLMRRIRGTYRIPG